jgi:Flp pilus assembly pilin Flp
MTGAGSGLKLERDLVDDKPVDVLAAIVLRLLNERGQSITEYAILLTWIALLVIVAVSALGHSIGSVLSATASKV